MGYGIGLRGDVGFGDADSWGGPVNGVDLQGQMGLEVQAKSYRLSEDAYLALIIVGALIVLWLFGGIAFKSVRL